MNRLISAMPVLYANSGVWHDKYQVVDIGGRVIGERRAE